MSGTDAPAAGGGKAQRRSARGGARLRPRVWVPGVAYVDDERHVHTGPAVGFVGRGPAFRHGRCGRASGIAEWRHRAWLVERAALSPALVREQAIILPETLVDAEAQPHARRWLREQPLVCVSGQKLERLCARGLRVYCVEHGVERPGWLSVRAAGGKRSGWQLAGPLDRTIIDRLLHHLTAGVLTEAAVDQALSARVLVEPGYGYDGATDGTPASLEAVARALRPLEALFAPIYARAEPLRAEARELGRAIEGAGPDEPEVPLPIYGSARRETLEALSIELDDTAAPAPDRPRWHTGGNPRAVLELPVWPRWTVERVELWSPELPDDLDRALDREAARGRRGSQAREVVVALALLGLLAAALMWWLW